MTVAHVGVPVRGSGPGTPYGTYGEPVGYQATGSRSGIRFMKPVRHTS